MRLTCNQCWHQWEDDLEDERADVFCPRCTSRLPISEATLSPEELRKSTPPPSRPAAVTPDADATLMPDQMEEGPGEQPTIAGIAPAGGSAGTTPFKRPPGGTPPSAPIASPTPAKGSSPTVPRKEKPSAPSVVDDLIGKTVEGYRIEAILGAGGMGAVFRAHQISLDRDVAFKVLPSRFAYQPEFLARFTREALSAAQLTHHNVVQVYDVGSADDVNFISMEYVRGQSLGEAIKKDGKLRVDDAAGYVLQAARGLKYAHEHGIIHRDIKPDNLMVNEQGIVKIADMGLAKRLGDKEDPKEAGPVDDTRLKQIGGDLTVAHVGMGTPAYMPPEQARDARSVDARADQYSLGCTLYYLCAGRPPYSGKTAFELISKHVNEPLTPLDVHVSGVPPAFKKIMERMLAKKPDDRYPGMTEVVKDLETYLDIDSEKGPFRPRDQHLASLEAGQKDYYSAPSLKKRKIANLAFFTSMPVFLLLAIFMGNFQLAGGIIGLLILTPFANFVIEGIRSKTFLFRRVRSVFFGMPLKSWAATIGGGLVALAALYVLGWLMFWIAFAVVAVGLATGYRFLVTRPLTGERTEPIGKIQDMLKELRLRGLAEDAIQDFVCRFSGERWEECFEQLFGYEDMILARGRTAASDKIKSRKKYATWRDPIARWLDGLEETRKIAREKKQLAKVEAKRLKAKGVSEEDAEKQAEQEAKRFVAEEHSKAKTKEETKAAMADWDNFKAKKGSRLTVTGWFRFARLLTGVGIIAGFALQYAEQFNIPVPEMIAGQLDSFYGWGDGKTYFGLAAGVALLLSSFSVRTLASIVISIGAVLMVALNLIVEFADQPQFTDTTAFWGAAGLIAAGVGYLIMGKLTGGKF